MQSGAVEAPEPGRVAAEGVDMRDLHRIDLLPEPLTRGAEVRDPAGHGDAGAGQRDRRGAPQDQLGEPVGLVGCYLPCHLGDLLPRKAEIPSLASWDRKAVAKPSFSASIPSSRSALLEIRLICSTATGACSASLRAQATAVSSSSSSGTRASARPQRDASGARTASPVRFISRAFDAPTSRGRRWVPPNPGMIPRLISGWPKTAEYAATRKSHAMASSQPPPKAIALTAATVDLLFWPNSRSRACPPSISSAPAASSIEVKALMSAPAEKTTGSEE